MAATVFIQSVKSFSRSHTDEGTVRPMLYAVLLRHSQSDWWLADLPRCSHTVMALAHIQQVPHCVTSHQDHPQRSSVLACLLLVIET